MVFNNADDCFTNNNNIGFKQPPVNYGRVGVTKSRALSEFRHHLPGCCHANDVTPRSSTTIWMLRHFWFSYVYIAKKYVQKSSSRLVYIPCYNKFSDPYSPVSRHNVSPVSPKVIPRSSSSIFVGMTPIKCF